MFSKISSIFLVSIQSSNSKTAIVLQKLSVFKDSVHDETDFFEMSIELYEKFDKWVKNGCRITQNSTLTLNDQNPPFIQVIDI